jgi:hypothetical protein
MGLVIEKLKIETLGFIETIIRKNEYNHKIKNK